MRTACLLIPNLPLAAELRAHPEFTGEPLAVATASGPRAELVAVSPEAEQRGVRRAASVAHARAVCVELIVRVDAFVRFSIVTQVTLISSVFEWCTA